MSYPLATVSATFVSDGAGGTVARTSVTPSRAGISWDIDQITTTVVPPTVPSSKLFIYRGVESNTTYAEGTNTGDGDTTNTPFRLGSIDRLSFKWTGGTLGAIATATLFGEITDARTGKKL